MSPRDPREQLGWRAFVWLDDAFKQPVKLTSFGAAESKDFPYLSHLLPETMERERNPQSDHAPVPKWRLQVATILLAAFILKPSTNNSNDAADHNSTNNSNMNSQESGCQAKLANMRKLILDEMPEGHRAKLDAFLTRLNFDPTAPESQASAGQNLAMLRSLMERSLVITEHVRQQNGFQPL